MLLISGTVFSIDQLNKLMFPLWLQAGLWGLLSGSALVMEPELVIILRYRKDLLRQLWRLEVAY
jgi:hypothetical protein